MGDRTAQVGAWDRQKAGQRTRDGVRRGDWEAGAAGDVRLSWPF